MADEVKGEEAVVVSEGQQNEINDLLADYVPPAEEGSGEVPTEEEGAANGEEGKEREAEAASGQVKTPTDAGEEEGGEVKPEEKPAEVPAVKLGEKPAKEEPAEKPVEKKETNEERLQRENEELRRQLVATAEKLYPTDAPKPTPEQEADQKKRLEAASKQVLNFLKDEASYDIATKDAASFNALLTAVVNTAVSRTIQLVPHVTSKYVDSQMTNKESVVEFFKANEDLLPYRKFIGFISNEVIAAHPDYNITKVLEETEKEARVRLNLVRAAGTQGKPGDVGGEAQSRTVNNNPGFIPGGSASGRRGAGNAEQISKEQKQINDLIS